MMIQFQVISSSSNGNCSLLEYKESKVLIDAGIGIRSLEKFLEQKNLAVSDINAIFITHEHGDHCKMLNCLSKYQNLCVFANEMTAEMVMAKFPKAKNLHWKIFHTGDLFEYGEMKVQSFSVPHDANDTVGYKFDCGGENFVWMTDLGYVSQNCLNMAKLANLLVLESNYDPQMLENSTRTYSLKRRIRGSSGHLSNDDALSLLQQLDFEKLRKVYLAHVSRECNNTALIAEKIKLLGQNACKIEIVNPFTEVLREVRAL